MKLTGLVFAHDLADLLFGFGFSHFLAFVILLVIVRCPRTGILGIMAFLAAGILICLAATLGVFPYMAKSFMQVQ
jgi:hypothetical protein